MQSHVKLALNLSHCSVRQCYAFIYAFIQVFIQMHSHLKLNSEENQYDKLLLVLSLNCFSLEIDTGARAIHHRLREVGTLRENSRASMWSQKKKENAMGVSVRWEKKEASLWQAGIEIRNKDREREKNRIVRCFCFSSPPHLFLSLRRMDGVQGFIRL